MHPEDFYLLKNGISYGYGSYMTRGRSFMAHGRLWSSCIGGGSLEGGTLDDAGGYLHVVNGNVVNSVLPSYQSLP
jgi:hypothetical protein